MTFKQTRKAIGKFFLGSPVSYGLWSWATTGKWTKTDLLDQYKNYLYTIISSIAEESAKIDFVAEKTRKDGARIPITTHPFIEMIKRPNPGYSQFQFFEMHFTYFKLMGESFWYIAKGEKSLKPKEFYLLRPDLMEVAVDSSDPRGLVTGYSLIKPDGKRVTFEKDEILHFKKPNPRNPYRGLGAVEAAKTYVETEDYTSTWTKNSVYNSGRPSGMINLKGVVSDEEYKEFKKQFKNQYSGIDNAGKTLVVRGADGIDYQQLGMGIGDIAMKELKDLSRDDIMVMFRVSKTILGITDDVNRANAEVARKVFLENVIKPEMERITDHINSFLIPLWGRDAESVTFKDIALTSDSDKLEEWKAGHNKWLTTNDIRNAKGLEPVTGGDEIYIPINLVAMGTDNNVPNGDKQKKKH